jgi:hypothetical protein
LGRQPLVTFWKTMTEFYACRNLYTAGSGVPLAVDEPGQHDFMSSRAFQECVWSFLERLSKDWIQACTCDVCGMLGQAPIIIADGTSLAFRRALDVGARAAQNRLPTAEDRYVHRGSTFANRIFLPDASLRLRLARFCNSRMAMVRGRVPPLTAAEAIQLYRDLVAGADYLVDLYSAAKQQADNEGSTFALPPYRNLLSALVKPTPIANGLIKCSAAVCDTLRRLSTEVVQHLPVGPELTGEDYQLLEDTVPVLYHYIQQQGNRRLTGGVIPIVRRLVALCDPLIGMLCATHSQLRLFSPHAYRRVQNGMRRRPRCGKTRTEDGQ